MRAVNFKQANVNLAKNQDQYNTLPAYMGQVGSEPEETGFITCFELSEQEIENINKHGKIWYTQMTFNNQFHPMSMIVANNIFDALDDKIVGKTKQKLDLEEITWQQLKDFVNSVPEDFLQNKVPLMYEDETFARRIQEPFFSEEDIYINKNDIEKIGTLKDLKENHDDEDPFNPDDYILNTKKGTPFLWIM